MVCRFAELDSDSVPALVEDVNTPDSAAEDADVSVALAGSEDEAAWSDTGEESSTPAAAVEEPIVDELESNMATDINPVDTSVLAVSNVDGDV